MNSPVEYDRLVRADEMAGDDDEDTVLLKESLESARNYLLGHRWCHSIEREFFGLGVGGVVSVFLFEIRGDPGVDERLWVVTGDLPSAYLVTDAAPTPAAALTRYCELMDDWIATVRQKRDVSEVFPVSAEPSADNADALESRMSFLRREIIPVFG